jgi:hypothetical protein
MRQPMRPVATTVYLMSQEVSLQLRYLSPCIYALRRLPSSTVYSVQDRHIDDDSERFAHAAQPGCVFRCPYEIGLVLPQRGGRIDKAYSASERSIHASSDVTVRRTWTRPTLRHQVRILIRGQSGSSRRETTRLPAEG